MQCIDAKVLLLYFLLRLPRLTNLIKGGYICMVLNFSRLKPKSLKNTAARTMNPALLMHTYFTSSKWTGMKFVDHD